MHLQQYQMASFLPPPILFLLGLHSDCTRLGPWICRPAPRKKGGLRLASADSELDEYKKVRTDATCWMSGEALPYHLTDLGYLAVCRVAETRQFAVPAKHICQAPPCQMAALRDFAANHRSSPCPAEDEGFITFHLLGCMCRVN